MVYGEDLLYASFFSVFVLPWLKAKLLPLAFAVPAVQPASGIALAARILILRSRAQAG